MSRGEFLGNGAFQKTLWAVLPGPSNVVCPISKNLLSGPGNTGAEMSRGEFLGKGSFLKNLKMLVI